MITQATVLGRLDIVARTLVGEAASDGRSGMEAVCAVIRNRADHARRGGNRALYGDGTMASACLMPWQFTCWKDLRDRLEAGGVEDWMEKRSYRIAFGIACRASAHDLPDPTGGATHFVLTSWLGDPNLTPHWIDARHGRFCARIGSHTFFDLGPYG